MTTEKHGNWIKHMGWTPTKTGSEPAKIFIQYMEHMELAENEKKLESDEELSHTTKDEWEFQQLQV